MNCALCDFTAKNRKSLVTHINHKHKMSPEEYYNKFIKTDTDGVCEYCGKPTEYKSFSIGYKDTCGRSCSIKLSNFKKYGVENASQIKGVSEKVKNTKKLRYGSESYNNSNKAKETLIVNNGTVEEAYKKRNEKTISTCISKYGVENPFQVKEHQEKMQDTMTSRYGVSHNSYLESTKNKRLVTYLSSYWNSFNIHLSNKMIKPLFDKDSYVSHQGEYEFECIDCGRKFTKHITNDKYAIRPQNIHCTCKTKGTSIKEKELYSLIDSNSKENGRRFSKDGKIYELDIYLPEYDLGIEFDGLYWHSDSFKDKNYHITKTEWFKDNFNIEVIHIFENEWDNKKDIVMSIIKNKMNKNNNRIFGRKTIKKEITQLEYSEFLEENHIQGSVISKTRLGLFHNNELVSVVGIGKSRFSKDEIELHRFCNKKGYSVLGGFSKLLKDFNNLTTYCDIRYFNASGYKKIGFVEEYRTVPGYFYFKKDKILSRYQCQKHKQSEFLNTFDSEKTGYENMLNNGYNRIYDCGNIKLRLIK